MARDAGQASDSLEGRMVWIPPMTHIGARMCAAAFKSVGVSARPTPPSNERTLELGGLYTSGEECYPQKITIGDFLRVMDRDDFDPAKTAFFMPTATGPCRFGQYVPYFRTVLDEMGYESIPIVSPSSDNSYGGVGKHGRNMIRTFWRGLVAADILNKMLLRTRPYETVPGAADEAFEQSAKILEVATSQVCSNAHRMKLLCEAMRKGRELFLAVPAKYTKDKPLIGVVGEIFCRLNTFSNGDAVRKIEAAGGEAWLSDIVEWVWYTSWSQKDWLRRDGKRLSMEMLGSIVRDWFQRSDEKRLHECFADDFRGYEEPHSVYKDVLKPGWPHLPADGVLGEMVLSVGKSIYLYDKGVDGIIDISPFSCMNGIVSEAVYHNVSSAHDDIPIRNFYFDSSSSNMERDLDIFMELTRSYRKRRKTLRQYPAVFEDA